ncbi:MAG TPA: class D beta-lactamase [Azospirillaceae bacterium]|nr:class D beta-lactamase [Azospirillaceae bacterium]
MRALLLALLLSLAPAVARADCTVLADAASGRVLHREGEDCGRRTSPASSFKLPLAVMGFDAGILAGPHAPVWPYKPEYRAWRESWKADIDPTSWMRESVVWYSQELTRAIGMARFQAYVDGFGYGNRDLTGEPGKGDGLTRAWLGTSLEVTPLEQVDFLRRLVAGELPASKEAQRLAMEVMPRLELPGGWAARGKTGTGLRRGADGKETDRQFGWYVGWADKDGRRVLFVRLVSDLPRSAGIGGFHARDTLAADWPRLAAALR